MRTRAEIDTVQDSTGRERATGYLHPNYAYSLKEFGKPRHLAHCGGWILERQIPGFSCHDAMGCYPLFVCEEWSQLHIDLKALDGELVSLSLVTDPFAQYDRHYLDQCFQDLVIPFKEHFIVDLSQNMRQYVSEHHRRYARKASTRLQVKKSERPIDLIDDWIALYDVLIMRHEITGIPAFSKSAFIEQLKIPGMVMFQSVHEGSTVGLQLWCIQNEVGYYHLGASSDLGYEMKASFALFWHAIEYFQDNKLRWLDIGAGAGVKNNERDGLREFKRGWSTGTRPTYLCGRIFDRAKYREIVKAKDITDADYFPAYRKGEFS
jgi:hypothetical protein